MTKNKLRRTFVAVLLLLSFVLPNFQFSARVSGAEGPTTFTSDPGYQVVDIFYGDSINSHTSVNGIVWVKGDLLYAAIASTHTIEAMTMYVNTPTETLSVASVDRWEYSAGAAIWIDGVKYTPPTLSGNTKSSHYTVFTFPKGQLQGTLSFFVKGQGGGHDLGGEIRFDLVTSSVTMGKIWTGGSIASGKTASFAIFGVAPSGVYRLDAYDVNDQVITPLTLTSNVSGARVSRTFQVPITTKFGERFTSYYVRELENGQVLNDGARTSDGYVVTYPGNALEAVNTYVPQPISVTFSGTKSLSGRPLMAGEFSFALYAQGASTPLAVTTNSELGAFSFAPQTYTAAGTYRYIIKETAGTLGGVTYDVREYPVTVTVTDNLKGVLSTSVSAPVGSFTFQNRYEALPASLILSGSKTLTGRPLLADEFTFDLYNAAGDILLDSASNTSLGTFQFDALTFQAPGTYTYVVKERKGTLPGMTYDPTEYTITVNVTDNLQGNLVASPVIPAGGIHFVNRYVPQNALVPISGLKILNGRALKAEEFQFVLKDAQGNPVGNPVTHDAQGIFRFPELALDKAGVFTYFLSEIPGQLGGISYDPMSYPVTISVTDDLMGKLHGVVLTPPVIFRNTYQPLAVTAVIRGQKVLEGRTLQSGEFQFVLEDVSGNPLGQAVANLADGSFQFPGIQFGQTGEYNFRVREVAGVLGGVTYDPSVKTVKITVTQNSEGELVAVVNPQALTFTNTYEAKPVGVTLRGEKRLTGRALKSGEFSFLLKDKTGAAVGTSVTHNALGEFSFPEILFTKTGVYTYTMEELPGTVPGITYDLTKKTVTITVTDDGKGQLQATVETLPVVITNTYTPAPVEVSLDAVKVLQGRSLIAGEFSFTLKGPQGETLGVYTHDASGKILLPKITLEAAGVYPYTLQENPGTLGGVTYDLTPKTLTVTVTDDGNGKLQATVNPTLTQITNTYTAKAVSVELKAEKHLTGRLLKAGEFSFILRNAAGAQLGLSVTNGSDGMITFPAWSFDAPGTYKFYLEEVQGTLGGVTYDPVIHEVTVTVTDDGKGQLQAAVSPELPMFTNTYKAKSVDVTLKGEKTLIGRPLLADEFSFILKDEAGDPVGSPVKNQADGSFSFPAQTFTKAGVYNYTISEVEGTLSGVNYDLEEKAVTITVTDDGNGQLLAEVTPDVVKVENTYGPTPATLILEGEKTLSGRPLKAGEFTFELWEKNGAVALQSTVNAADGSFAFEALKFTQAGTYTYTVKEMKGALGGITYDEMTYDITITVTDNLNGALVAAADYPEGGLKFVNTYKAASTTTVLEGKKTLEGRPLLANEFSFELWAGDELLHTVKNDADGSFEFPALTYTEVGTYTYTVKEVLGTLGGVTYDDAEFTITVTVKDNLDGTLTATPVYPEGGVDFVNTYKAASTTTVLEGLKTLEGRPLLAEEFSFELWAGDELLHTVKNDADGSFEFPVLTYTKAGTYTYTVKEVQGTLGGVTYDDAEFTITVTVKDNLDGTLTATPGYPEGGVEFVNTYKASSTTTVLEGLKTLEGRPLLANEFSFELWAEDELLHTVKNDADGSFEFPVLTYTKAGTYTYTVKEVQGTLGGVTYDDAEFTITVTVKDNLDGTLTATPVYPEGGVDFVNTYKAASTTTVLEGLKTLEGRPLLASEFSFELWAGDELLHTVKNDADGSFEFPVLTYTKAGTYTYTVKEVQGTLGGVTYDDAEFTITVTVKDNLDGTLTATPVYPEGGVDFVNTYKAASTTAILEGEKTLEGRPLLANEFSFELWADDELLHTVKNSADGSFSFPVLTYTEVGTYTYKVKEVLGTLGGVTYDDTEYTITVTVKDNLDGTLTATPVYPEGGVDFVNTYKAASTTTVLEGLKTLEGRPLLASEFSFELWAGDELLHTVKNDADGSFEFPVLTYTEAGTYTYTVKEVQGTLGGVTYDDAEFTITVTVKDNLDGTLTATPVYPEGGVGFVNTYKASSTTTVLEGLKTLEGRPLLAEEFSFELWAGDELLHTVKNDADGSFEFPVLTYTKAGTYTYTVKEVLGTLGGVTYDDAEFTITVTVKDNLDGTLTATPVYPEGGVEFVNIYQAAKTTYILSGLKTLLGRELKAGEFTFELWAKDGEEALETVQNAADGTYVFTALEFAEAGVYGYEIRERKESGYGVIYDETVYPLVISVTDNLDGTLTATADKDPEDLLFENRYAVITVKGEKTWDDLGLRPESITVQLLRNGVLYDDAVVEADENGKWLYEFPELAEFDETGEAYRYTVNEVPVPGFEVAVDGYNLLNRLLRGKLTIEKVDDAGRPLAGVDFVIRDAEEQVVFTGTTGETGILTVILPLGSYTVMETKAPENYIMDEEAKTVSLTKDGEEVTLRVVNVLEIEDVQEKPLPSTGSAGGSVFLFLGLTLLGAGLLLLKKQETV